MGTSTFGKLKQESTSDRIYAAIREAIFSGRLKTGQRLTEIQMAKEFEVSRASLREALQRLSHEGLVELNSYKGARVIELTPEQLDEMLALRLLLEAEAVRQAKRRLTQTDRDVLYAIARKLHNPGVNPRAYPTFDFELHQTIWEISGNRTLQRHLSLLVSPLFAMGTILRYSESSRDRSDSTRDAGVDHISLVEAICDGTEERAIELMQRHILDNWKVTRSRIESFMKQDS
ncbi:MAG TPA: GntR family transcriptional regulator [Bryobacteraceae bacterium]|nr:GntR family transcriptional regulator [Bryobacteraceae bacterium]